MENKNSRIERLEDTSLSRISGGLEKETKKMLMCAGEVAMCTGLVASAILTTASVLCCEAAANAEKNSDMKAYKKYSKAAKNLYIADSIIFGLGTAVGLPAYTIGRWA